jgi:branched-chain amino acid transport system ATP-binding protein
MPPIEAAAPPRHAPRAFVLETGTITLSGPSTILADDPRIREAYLGG